MGRGSCVQWRQDSAKPGVGGKLSGVGVVTGLLVTHHLRSFLEDGWKF